MQYQIIGSNGAAHTVSLFYSDGTSAVIPANHPNFTAILDGLRSGTVDETQMKRLVDTLVEVAKTFTRLTERISLRGRKLYFDGDRIRGPIVKHIIRMVQQGEQDQAEAVSCFLEKLATNPSAYARENLYVWLEQRDFTITTEGDFIAYKGMARAEDGTPTSISHGQARVNGTVHTGAIPNPLGATVEMPRSRVDDGAHNYCSTGLHAGTYEFARGFAGVGSPIAAVVVNPRDVVSVPDAGQKLRVCRYQVIDYVTSPYSQTVRQWLTDSKLEQLPGEEEPDVEEDDFEDDEDDD
jgi:hypothetical protein